MVFIVVLVILVGAIGVASQAVTGPATVSTANESALGSCSAESGAFKTTLSSQSFGEVTTYRLPKPLRAPNSIAAAPDGSVWFGEVALRGVAHLYGNGTFVEYPWPSNLYSAGSTCYDLNQLIGLNPSNDTFSSIPLKSGDAPLYLAIDRSGNLWFTTSAEPAQVGVVYSANGSVSYFPVPVAAGEYAASLTFYNSTLAYLAAVSASANEGQILSFDPLAPDSSFHEVGGNQSLLGPYSVAEASGGVWVGEHDASDVAFFNLTSRQWSFYPTSLNPEVPLTLPYYLISNGSSVWFNEHDGNKIAEITDDGSALTEFNVSESSTKSGIANVLTVGLDRNLLWFTGWTGNVVGFVNASIAPGFSIFSSANATDNDIEQGASRQFQLEVTGDSSARLTVQFADSESHTSVPLDISLTTNFSAISGLNGTRMVELTVNVSAETPSGRYLVLVTVTDGLTFRSVYIPVAVTDA
ncbi:MAG: hypothetical protein OK456_03225 [Thaumarchaeota archaeon]|nr:hypothetical protein [Nitrososphaerota archaeon]